MARRMIGTAVWKFLCVRDKVCQGRIRAGLWVTILSALLVLVLVSNRGLADERSPKDFPEAAVIAEAAATGTLADFMADPALTMGAPLATSVAAPETGARPAHLALAGWFFLLSQDFEKADATLYKALLAEIEQNGENPDAMDAGAAQAAAARLLSRIWPDSDSLPPLRRAQYRHFAAGLFYTVNPVDGLTAIEDATAAAADLEPAAPLVEAPALLLHAYALWRRGDRAEAETLVRRALDLQRQALPHPHPLLGRSLHGLGVLRRQAGADGEAAALYEDALAIQRAVLPEDHPDIARILRDQAVVFRNSADYVAAEKNYRSALLIQDRSLAPDDPQRAVTLNGLAALLQELGRYTEAEPLFRRSLHHRETGLGPGHPMVARALTTLAALYVDRKEPDRALPLLDRAQEILTIGGSPRKRGMAIVYNLLGLAYERKRDHAKAEEGYRASLANWIELEGPDHPATRTAQINLAAALRFQGSFTEAEALLRDALTGALERLGPDHPDTARLQSDLAGVLRESDRLAEADTLYRTAQDTLQDRLSPDHPDIVQLLHNRAKTALARGDRDAALAFLDDASGLAEQRIARTRNLTAGQGYGAVTTERLLLRSVLVDQARVAAILHQETSDDRRDISDEAERAFRAMQLARGISTAQAVARMSARFSLGNSPLAQTIKQRDDAAALWQRLDRKLATAFHQSAGSGRDAAAEMAVREQMVSLEKTIRETSRILETEFPDYAELTNLAPIDLATAQSKLRPDEALLSLIVGENGGAVLAVTVQNIYLVPHSFGSEALDQAVERLRGGLDPLRVQHDPAGLGAFSLAAAYSLYRDLLAPILPALAGIRHIYYVPDGAMQSLPIGVLVTAAPEMPAPPQPGSDDPETPAPLDPMHAFREAEWLALHHTFSVLPAISSLTALHSFGRRLGGEPAFLGVGDPILQGHPQDGDALRSTLCAPEGLGANVSREPDTAGAVPGTGRSVTQTANPSDGGEMETVPSLLALSTETGSTNQAWAFRASSSVAPANLFSGPYGAVDLCAVASIPALPDTAVELKALASVFRDGKASLMLQGDAREHRVRSMSDLERFSILAFATHGVIAGELEGLAEPALVLTPPSGTESLEDDDGLLTATEITGLSLNADWVILSACNTAAPDGSPHAENLSGLARAFFHAGARALFVSHWQVVSDATSALSQTMLRAYGRGETVTRSEAHRRAMRRFITDPPHPNWAHPLYWGPFMVVGAR